ncbi:MAG TPA: type I-U CRISPR-associated protein Csb2, partial [Stellaceae bacterium]
MTLVLEIEHLLGVAFAARSQASDVPDWPPQPDRAYSALVATWAARVAVARIRRLAGSSRRRPGRLPGLRARH